MPPVADPIDVEALLAPIPGANPAGEDLRHTLYDEVKEARRSDDNLEQGIWKRDVKAADWRAAVQLTSQALATRSKDLNLGCWLTEGLAYEKGFAGVQAGLRVIAGLLARYWDGLYPEIDPESPGEEFLARANSLEDFDRKASFALLEIPVVRWSGPAYNMRQWEESRAYDVGDARIGQQLDADAQARLIELRQKAEADRKVCGDDYQKAREATPKSFYADTFEAVSRCREAFAELQATIDDRFGRQAFGLRDLEKAITTTCAFAERNLKEKRALEPDPVDGSGEDVSGGEAGAAAGEGPGAGAGGGGGTGPIRSREDAIRRLTEAADYIRRTEPHSPVPFLVLRAISWARMPLDAWLSEVVKDGATLEAIRDLLTTRPEAGEGS